MLTVRSTINIASQTVPPIIPVVQGDTGRAILFTLADFTIPTGATATYYVQKPSGEAVYNNATIDGNNVLVNLTAQSIIEKGDNYGQVRIIVGEDVVTSFDFILLVKEFRGIDAVQSLTEMNIFDKAVEQAADAIDEVKTDALEAIDDAKDEAIEEVTSSLDAITQEFDSVKNTIGDLSGETVTPTATNNYGIGGSVGQVIETWATTMYWHGIYTVSAGNTYGITTVSDFPQQLVVWFTNASNTIIENHKAFATDHVEMVCTAPTGATKLFVMSYGFDAYHGTVQKVEPLSETVSTLKEDFTAIESSMFVDYTKPLIDHSSNLGTGAYSTNGRWFVDGVVPSKAKINKIKYFCASATSGTVTFEIWELDNGYLDKVYEQTETPTASSVNTANINFYTDKPCMVSFKSSAENARMDSLATGKNTYYIADLTSDTIAVSSLSSYSGFELCATIDYTVYINKDYIAKTWGVLPDIGETVTNVYTPKYRALLGRALKNGDYLTSVSVYSRSSSASGQIKVELWSVSGTTMTLADTYTSSFGSAVGTVEVTIDKEITTDTRVTVTYIPTSDSANWAWGRTSDNVGTGIYNTSDIASSTLSLPSNSFGDVASEFILNNYTPFVQMNFVAKNTKGIVTVGVNNGSDFTTIQEAIDGSDEGDTIIVSEGIYEESVKCAGRMRNIVGTNMNNCVLINHSGNYYTPPIEMNVGSIENMTIISDASDVDTSLNGANLAYCIHCDFDCNSMNNSWIARNLKMVNANRPCIGMGLHQNYDVLVEACRMDSGVHIAGDARGAFYFHTRNIAGVTAQTIKVKNCEIVCADTKAMTVMQLQSGAGKAEFIGNTVYSEQDGVADSIIWDGTGTVSFDSTFALSEISNGNTVSIINSL